MPHPFEPDDRGHGRGHDRSHDRNHERVWRWWAILALVMVVLSLRVVHLTADTPAAFAPPEIGLRVDEGYKTLGPRNLVLFDRQKWSPADEYPGWFAGSPLTQWLIYVAFRIAEPSVAVARTASLLYFLALAAMVLFDQCRRLSTVPLLLVAGLLATEPFLFCFSRAALFEIAMAAMVTAGFLAVRKAGPDRPWPALAAVFTLMIAAYFLVKVSALLYFLPGLGVLLLFVIGRSRPRVALLAGAFAVVGVALLLFLEQDLWTAKLSSRPAGRLFGRFLANSLITLTPWLSAAAWLGLADLIRRRGRRLLADPYLLVLAATILGTPLILAFMSYGPSRYYVAIAPAQILVVAYWLEQAWDGAPTTPANRCTNLAAAAALTLAAFIVLWAGANLVTSQVGLLQGDDPGVSAPAARRFLFPVAVATAMAGWVLYRARPAIASRCHRWAILALIAAAIIAGSANVGSIWFSPDYASREIREQLVRTVPPGAAVIGDWAPFFALGTQVPAVYSTIGLNNGPVILEICPRYYVYAGTRGDSVVVESYQDRAGVTLGEPTILGSYAGKEVSLRPLVFPAGACE